MPIIIILWIIIIIDKVETPAYLEGYERRWCRIQSWQRYQYQEAGKTYYYVNDSLGDDDDVGVHDSLDDDDEEEEDDSLQIMICLTPLERRWCKIQWWQILQEAGKTSSYDYENEYEYENDSLGDDDDVEIPDSLDGDIVHESLDDDDDKVDNTGFTATGADNPVCNASFMCNM